MFIRAAHLSYNRVYFCDNLHYCRGLSLFSERVPISLYNTPNPCTLWFWITWSFCVSLNLWIKELLDRARRKLCITLCRSWLAFRRCLRWMTIGLTTGLEPRGKVCLCVCSIICGGYKRVGHNEDGLVFIFRHTCTQTHKRPVSMHWCAQCYDSGTMSSTVSRYLPIFVLKYRQNNSSGTR